MRYFKLSIAGIICFCSFHLFAQSAGDYRSVGSGPWTTPANWERFDGLIWQTSPAPPSSGDGIILIQTGHVISVSNGVSVTADQVILLGGLTIDAGGELAIADGSGVDLSIVGFNSVVTVNGTLIRHNLSQISNLFTADAILFNSGAVYDHRYTTTIGDMPPCRWDANSTILFSGFTNTTQIDANNTWANTYGHVTFNAPGQRALVNFAGNLTTIAGDLNVLSTGTNAVQLSNSENLNLTIGGNLTISGTARLIFSVSGDVAADIAGDINFSSGTAAATYATFTGSTTINLNGNLVINAPATGRFRLAGAGTTGNTVINLLGDLSVLSGRLEEVGTNPSQGTINFIRNGVQTVTNTGVISGYINYYVSQQTTLELGTSSLVGANPATFTLDGGTIVVGSTYALGAIHSGTAAGNIRTPNALRTYAPGSTIIYRGSAPMMLGSGHPLNTDITTIIDNPDGVSLATNRVINHPLILQSGALNVSNFTLTVNSTISDAGGFLTGTPLSRLYLLGTLDGPIGDLPFQSGAELNILTVNRTGEDVTATLTGPVTIHLQVNLTRGTLVNNGTLTLADSVVLTRYETAELTGSAPVTAPGDTYNVTYRTFTPGGGPFAVLTGGVELPTDPAILGNLTIYGQQSGDQFSLDRDITINGILSLVRGTLSTNEFDIAMNGTNWNDNGGNLNPGTGVVIFGDSTLVNGTSNPLFGNISATSDAIVDFGRNFSVTGNVDFAAGSDIRTNNVVAILSGGQPQVVSANGATFANINIAKSGSQGITLTSPLNLTGLLQFTSPSSGVNLQSNGNLVLVSTSDGAGSGTARIYRLNGGNQVSGDVTVQRFMSGEGRIYRYITSPISDGSVADWIDDFFVGGSFSDPSPTQNICGLTALSTNATIFYYDETVGGNQNQGYVNYPTAGLASANPLDIGRGYAVFIRVCDAPTVIDYTGTINSGTITLPVTYTNNDVNGVGWNLVGNPYPCPVDWDAGWTKTRVSPIIVINDNGGGIHRYYEAGVTDDIPNGQLAIGQAFWVRATAANPILRVTENSKITTVPEFFREGSPAIPSFYLALSNGVAEDKSYVKTVAGALNGLDDFDAPKIINPLFSMYTVANDNVPMAINAIEDLKCGSELRVGLNGLGRGTYTFSLNTRGFFEDLQFVLIDKVLNKELVLDNKVYEFSITEDMKGAVNDRFVLRIEQKTFAPVDITSATACGTQSEIVLNNVVSKAKFSVWTVDGMRISDFVAAEGKSLTIHFASESLAMGDNELVVMATGSCGTDVPASGAFTLTRQAEHTVDVATTWNCAEGSAILVANTGFGDDAIRWYEQELDVEPLHVGATFETPAIAKNKTYFVEALTAGGCVTSRTPVAVVAPQFTPPTLEVEGNTLKSNYAEGNRWFLNGVEVFGRTNDRLRMTNAGEYVLMVAVNGCEITLSHMLETSIRGLDVYPNPATNRIFLDGITDDVLTIDIVSPAGVKITTVYRKSRDFDGHVNIESLPNGVYLLIVITTTEKQIHRIIKTDK